MTTYSNDENGTERRFSLDQQFKELIHNSDVLSWILRGNVDELKGRSIEEIKSCLTLGEDGRTVIWHMTFVIGELQSMTLMLR